MRYRLVLAACVAVVLGCDFSAIRDLGETCTATSECEETAECVIVDDGRSFCLPRPLDRAERSCAADADCTLSNGELWPVEAECLDGACRCLGAEVRCSDDGVTSTFQNILEEETCRCVPRGNEGDTCITSHTCDIGLACTGGECRSAVEQEGSACRDSGDCSDTTTCSERRDNNDVGICR